MVKKNSNIRTRQVFPSIFFFFVEQVLKRRGPRFFHFDPRSLPSIFHLPVRTRTRRYTLHSLSRFMTRRFLAPLHPLTLRASLRFYLSFLFSLSLSLSLFFCFSLKLFLQNSLRFPRSFPPLARNYSRAPVSRDSRRLRFSR